MELLFILIMAEVRSAGKEGKNTTTFVEEAQSPQKELVNSLP